MLQAIEYCQTSRLSGATYVKNFLEYNSKPKQEVLLHAIPLSNKIYHVTTEKRSLEVYANAGGSI